MIFKIYKLLIFLNNLLISITLSILNINLFLNKKSYNVILYYRVGRVGDCAVSIPCIKAIKDQFPKSKLIVFTSIKSLNSPSFLDFKDLLNYVDVFESYDHKKDNLFYLIRKLRGYKIDLWINSSQDLTNIYSEIRNIFFAKICSAKKIFGSEVNTIKFLAKYLRNINFIPEKNRLLKNLKKIGINYKPTDNELLIFDKKNYLNLNKKISKIKLDRNVLAISPGANKKANIWNIENFINIAHYWVNLNRNVILLGSKDDYNIAKKIEAIIDSENLINFAGKLTISETSYLLSKSKVLVTNDSGLMHIADLLNIFIFAIFSCRDLKSKWHPTNNKSKVYLKNDSKCTPFTSSCKYEKSCINEINYSEIITDLKKLN
tara:strand:- start:648 stop:1772 length:1125 start_codon:yes stop_codon:yes gene_type:complete